MPKCLRLTHGFLGILRHIFFGKWCYCYAAYEAGVEWGDMRTVYIVSVLRGMLLMFWMVWMMMDLMGVTRNIKKICTPFKWFLPSSRPLIS